MRVQDYLNSLPSVSMTEASNPATLIKHSVLLFTAGDTSPHQSSCFVLGFVMFSSKRVHFAEKRKNTLHNYVFASTLWKLTFRTKCMRCYSTTAFCLLKYRGVIFSSLKKKKKDIERYELSFQIYGDFQSAKASKSTDHHECVEVLTLLCDLYALIRGIFTGRVKAKERGKKKTSNSEGDIWFKCWVWKCDRFQRTNYRQHFFFLLFFLLDKKLLRGV